MLSVFWPMLSARLARNRLAVTAADDSHSLTLPGSMPTRVSRSLTIGIAFVDHCIGAFRSISPLVTR